MEWGREPSDLAMRRRSTRWPRKPSGNEPQALANLLQENRRFAPPAELAAEANVTADAYAEAAADRLGFWAEQAAGCTGPSEWDRDAGLVEPAVREVVRRRQAQRRLQLRRPARRGRPRRPGRHPLGGRARATPAPSPTPSCTARSARPPTRCWSWASQQGRPGRDLHADDPRGGGRDARLRPHRRRALASSSAASPPTRWPTASRTPTPRSSSPPTAATGAATPSRAQAGRRRGRRRSARASSTCSWSAAPARTSPGPRAATCWWHDVVERPATEHTARAVRRRAPAVHPLHLAAPRRSRRASCTPPAAT